MILPLFAPLILAQTFTISHVTTTPGIKESAVRAKLESTLPDFEKCKLPYPLSAGDETDDRIIISFKTPVREGRIDVQGEIDKECVQKLLASWAFATEGARIEIALRAKFDFAASRRKLQEIEGHLKFACAAFIKHFGNRPLTENDARFEAIRLTQADLFAHAAPGGKWTEPTTVYVRSLVDCSPADFGALLNSTLEDLGLAPDDSCKKVLGWFKTTR